MGDDREYEAGTELDPAAQAVVDAPEVDDAPPARQRPKPEPDFDASAPKVEEKANPDEERAARMGWAPKDQWKGSPDRWVDAKTFIDRANPAMLLERMDRMAREHETTVERMERMNQLVIERERQAAAQQLADLKAERDRLLAQYANDPASLRKIADNYEKARDELQQEQAPQQPSGPPPEVRKAAAEAREAWLKTRPEYTQNRRFAAAALAEMEVIKDELADRSFSEQFAELDRRLAPDFPAIYGRQPAAGNGAPPAEMRAQDGIRVSTKKTTNYASRLNAAERAQGERFVRQGLFKDMEAYAKEVHDNG